jgi:predicted DCC family thiol-disulfide oxidoreductase YuxK
VTAEASTVPHAPHPGPEAATDPFEQLPPRIVFFDGVCSFCDGAVAWLRDRDPHGRLFFASLQGETARRFRRAFPSDFPADLDSIVYVDRSEATERSGATSAPPRIDQRADAIIRLCEEIGGGWEHARLLRRLPDWLTDLAYRAFAGNRYRMFGRLDACRIATPEEQKRLLP